MTDRWQTPATDSFRSRGGPRKNEMGLDQQSRFWKTPHGMGNTDFRGKRGSGGEFAKQAMAWQSPQSRDFRSGKIEPKTAAKHLGTRPLNEQVQNWHTPSTEDHMSDGPRAQGRYGTEEMKTSDQRLRNQVYHFSLPARRTSKNGKKSSAALRTSRLRLNPLFVTWLMGWPPWWTVTAPMRSAPLAMESWLSRQRWLLESLLDARDNRLAMAA
jgi:hypothetical protein